MIVEWLMSLGVVIAKWFLGLLPPYVPPAFFQDLDGQLNSVFANLNGVGVWADWGYLLVVVMAVVFFWGLGFALKGLAWLWAQIPVIGGGG